MKNIQVSLSHKQYWPVNISHLFHNQSKPKLNQKEKTQSITAIYMSIKLGSWKQSTSTMFVTLILYSIYTCAKNWIQRTKGWNLYHIWYLFCISQEAIFFLPFSSLSSSTEGRILARNDPSHDPLLWLEHSGRGWPTLSPNFDARESQIPHYWSKETLSKAA